MCGIMGAVSLRPTSDLESIFDAWLTRGLAAMEQRGPDASGRFVERGLALGSRRLRIHDLDSRADQPLLSQDGRRVVIFNGAIFNYRALREELEQLGHVFRTTSDTEVVLAAIEQEGPKAFKRFQGMFSVAWYDRDARRLVLGRDKFGIKPLYTYSANGLFAFASEIKPLLAHPQIPRSLNPDAVAEFVAFQFVAPPDTLFHDIKVFKPGHYVDFIIDDPVPPPSPYWRIDSGLIGDPGAPSVEEALEVSLRRCWDSDRPVGIQLSGGVDSSLLTALSHDRLGRRNLETYSVIFDDHQIEYYLPRSEERWIQRVAKQFGAANEAHLFSMEEVSPALAESIWYHEHPLYGASSCLYMLLARHIRDKATVLLTGEGADDIFLGYFSDWEFSANPRSFFKTFVNMKLVSELFGPNGEEQAFAKRLALAAEPRLDGMTGLQKASVMTIETVLHGLLARHDRMFMSQSIEGRPPFCTEDMVRARFALDDTEIKDDTVGKLVLKRLAERYFDKDFVYRKKIGFSVPFGDWCANPYVWRGYVERLNFDFLSDLIDVAPLRERLAMPEGAAKWSGQNLNLIFSLTQLQLWHDIFIDSPDPLVPTAWQHVLPEIDLANRS